MKCLTKGTTNGYDGDDAKGGYMESSDEESGIYEYIEEESISEVDDDDKIYSDSNGEDSVDSGDITNSSYVEEDMMDGLHAEDSADNEYYKQYFDKQLEGSNNMDTDNEDSEDEVDIYEMFDQDLRE